MEMLNDLTSIKKEIKENLIQDKKPCIELTVPSMMHESPEKIEEEIKKFNKKVDYLLEKGQDFEYITAEKNGSFSYSDLLFLEEISNKIKKEIHKKKLKNNIEKARLIEYNILNLITPVSTKDEDFDSSCDINLIQALKKKRGSCCHFTIMTQFLHLRNNMYSDIIYSKSNIKKIDEEKDLCIEYYHMFNLLFIGKRSKQWTVVDSIWEIRFFRGRNFNQFSFASFEDIKNNIYDNTGAHKNISQKINDISTIGINIEPFDKKLGFTKIVHLYPTCAYAAIYINEGKFEQFFRDSGFREDDKTICNLRNEKTIIQNIGMVAYICSLELGNKGLKPTEKREDEDVLIKHLDTYLKFIIPDVYEDCYYERIKNNNPEAMEGEAVRCKYLNSLFNLIKDEKGNLRIDFNDNIDKFSLYIKFSNPKNLPIVEVLKS